MGHDPTQRRGLGSSGVSVSRLALGGAPLGGLYEHVTDADATAVVRSTLGLGLNLIDTAPLYGHGTSERRIGAALTGTDRSAFVVATKVGRLVVDDPDGRPELFADAPPTAVTFDFSADGVRRSLDASLERLGLDRVDVVHIHDPDDHEVQAIDEAYPALHELRAQGVVGAIGVGMNHPRIPTRFVRETDVDAVLIAGRFTLLDQSAAVELLPACLERGVSVIVGGVFNSGILADPRDGATYDYAAAPPEVLARARHLGDICARHGVSLAAAALHLPLAHHAVTSVLVGARRAGEIEHAVAAARSDIPPDLWSELAAEGLLAAEVVDALTPPEARP